MEETSMVTELIFAVSIIALSAVILWALLFGISVASVKHRGTAQRTDTRVNVMVQRLL